MTDTSKIDNGKGGVWNASFDVIFRMVSQNVTPVIVGGLCAKVPVLSESTWFEITVFVLAGIGTGLNKLMTKSIWDNIAAFILYTRRGFKKINSAKDEPL